MKKYSSPKEYLEAAKSLTTPIAELEALSKSEYGFVQVEGAGIPHAGICAGARGKPPVYCDYGHVTSEKNSGIQLDKNGTAQFGLPIIFRIRQNINVVRQYFIGLRCPSSFASWTAIDRHF